MAPFTLVHARDALRATLPVPEEPTDGRTAAVAAVLRERDGRVEMLFIRRATRRGDPWSGHMAWPGGKREASDDTIVACAVRETREELGLDLDVHGELIGFLSPVRFDGRRATGLRAVFACVFELRETPPLVPSDEVQEAVWIPLDYFTGWTSRRPWSWLARWLPPVPPAYRYEGRVVWGLTLWMLSDLLRRLGP
jgi:8-oxo-dGTP pyrophosphatase MutT (NUDIX family)